MSNPFSFPEPPVITQDDLRKCRESGDYCPVLFEWYKFIGLLCNFFSRIRADSPALRPMPPLHFAALIGLLNRCARLMLSNVTLSWEGLFGETTAIIDRCIFESSVKVSWLCHKGTDEAFERFLADGLKTELEFKRSIQANINARGGIPLQIERRMLTSVDRYIASSGLTEAGIASAKKLPDLASMIQDLWHDRLIYTIGHRIGSHYVHGTWPSLRMHYLEDAADGHVRPRDHDCRTNVNQYLFVPVIVLGAMESFINFVCSEPEHLTAFSDFLKSVRDEIQSITVELVGNDFERVSEI